MIYHLLSNMAWRQQQPEEQVYLPKLISRVINLQILLSLLLTKTNNLCENTVVPEELINQSCNLWLQRALYFQEQQNTHRELRLKDFFGLRTLLAFSPSTSCTCSCSWFAFLWRGPSLESKWTSQPRRNRPLVQISKELLFFLYYTSIF